MKNAWHRFQRYYFSFNRSDRNATVILAGLVVLLIIAKNLLPLIIPEQKTDFTQIKAAFEEWEKTQSIQTSGNEPYLFTFDPNIITKDAMDSLNLPAFVKQNILSYRKAGGRFSSAEDIRKIYGMTDSIFQIIYPFVRIEKQLTVKKSQTGSISHEYARGKVNTQKQDLGENDTHRSKVAFSVELNKADSSALVALPGIGPVFAKRILRYRELLGGFYKKEQLLEVYNFPSETYNKLSERLQVDTLEIKKLRINFLDFSELLRHPYLNKTQVAAIIERREKVGPFKNISDLASIEAFDSETFARIRPYLNCR